MGRGQVDHRVDLRFGLLFTILVVGVLGGSTLWIWSVRERLPDPIARHWSGGTADGFSELGAVLAMSVALPLVVSVPLALVAFIGRSPLALRRGLGATSAFVLVFVTAMFVDSIRVQLDLADARRAPSPDVGLLAGLLLGLVGVALALVVVRDRPAEAAARRATAAPPADAPRLDQMPGLPWQAARTGADRAATITLGSVALLLVALVPLAGWPLLLPAPLLALVGVALGRFRVVVDGDGLEASALGRRILHAPLDEVAVADVVEVDPFWEFGGWGLRVDVAGRIGLVTRRGPAVRIRRGDDSEVLVSIDDAEFAASLLNTLADRGRKSPDGG